MRLLLKNSVVLYVIWWFQGIPEALMRAGAVYKYDLSIPLEHMYNLVEEMRSRLGKEQANVAIYLLYFCFPKFVV